MKTKIQKWGNSLGVRLPKDIAQNKSLKAGTSVLVSESDDKIVIETLKDESPSLTELINDISSENIHTETHWSSPKGNEVW